MIRSNVRTVGLVGTGVIGSGWAVRALARGLEVSATDPASGAKERLAAAVARGWRSAEKLGVYPNADPSRLAFTDSLAEVAETADLIQESVPEDEGLKKETLAAIDAVAPADVLIASSSSGLFPSILQAECRNPERIIVAHPFNPVYLLPLVEIVPGTSTSEEATAAAMSFYEDLGMLPLHVRTEIEGYLSDRLQEAMWREILHLVNEDVATTDELDRAIVYGPGLRWSGMGTNLSLHLAGGAGGMRHTLEQFGPALKLPWTRFEAPELTEELIEAMVSGTRDQADGRDVEQLERLRDDYLISVMRALRPHDIASGRIVARHEARIHAAGAKRWQPDHQVPTPLELYTCRVEAEWVDYNDHMTEAAYLTAFGWASDTLFRYLGDDEAYREGGSSFFTVETHINYVKEARLNDPLRLTTQLLGADTKRMHLFHTMYHSESGASLATTEQMLVHVDTKTGRSAPVEPAVQNAIQAVSSAHESLPMPENAGRVMTLEKR